MIMKISVEDKLPIQNPGAEELHLNNKDLTVDDMLFLKLHMLFLILTILPHGLLAAFITNNISSVSSIYAQIFFYDKWVGQLGAHQVLMLILFGFYILPLIISYYLSMRIIFMPFIQSRHVKTFFVNMLLNIRNILIEGIFGLTVYFSSAFFIRNMEQVKLSIILSIYLIVVIALRMPSLLFPKLYKRAKHKD